MAVRRLLAPAAIPLQTVAPPSTTRQGRLTLQPGEHDARCEVLGAMLTRMRETPKSGGAQITRTGVMAELPRSRPQRASARRTTAREADARPVASKRLSDEADRAAAAARTILSGLPRVRPQHTSARRAAARAARSNAGARAGRQPVPRQGFESDPGPMRGPVEPPGGAELAVSLGELAGELAKVGVATGARLLKDVLSRLPG
jgi:hypothetical protein